MYDVYRVSSYCSNDLCFGEQTVNTYEKGFHRKNIYDNYERGLLSFLVEKSSQQGYIVKCNAIKVLPVFVKI